MEKEEALKIAHARLAASPSTHAPDNDMVVWRLDEYPRAWVAHIATQRWLTTRALSDQLVGQCPLVIDKTTGNIHEYGSGHTEHQEYLAWLRPTTPTQEADTRVSLNVESGVVGSRGRI